MSDELVRIKRLILKGRYAFSRKARDEMEIDGVTELDVIESITNAVAIYKRVRSTVPQPGRKRDLLYIIHSTNLQGQMIYTKGKFVREAGVETFYFLISSKRAIR